MSLPLLKATIESYHPTHMTDEDVSNLELLLELPAFASLHDLVEQKIEAYWEWLHDHPVFNFKGTTATEKPSPAPAPAPKLKKKKVDDPTLTMQFRVDPKTGILTPVK